ncbi:interleukin-6 receptor subunit beta isoform X2 [Centroberyx affinis]|uniref:interleukin-6 receptor subunit beta isoform X2 n=1 Tax=Centroberyx affinis TaxID=166261 RepID=UPI003A5C215A
MERSPAMVWTCLLGTCLVSALPAFPPAASLAPPRPPRLVSCVFQQRANITCRWESGDPRPAATTLYTLLIERMQRWGNSSLSVAMKINCTTANNSCTVKVKNVVATFCITVTARSPYGVAKSTPRCQSGRLEVKLAPVILLGAAPVSGRPQCLMLTWQRPLLYVVSEPEVNGGNLSSQIEYSAQGQPSVLATVNQTTTSFEVCGLRPDTSYTIRLCHRFCYSSAPWSEWSNRCEGRTGEDAPSAAPAFWRQVKETVKNGWRLVLLLWKPLPHRLANGEVVSYSVTCRRKDGQVLNSRGGCGVLNHTNTSCSLLLPPERCSCSLTASNSAGTSPEARIWLPGASETDPPSPNHITVNPLGNNSLEVRWTAPADQSVSGFVVEWSAVTETNNSSLHWERLNSSCKALVITEGVKPMVRYAVSVKALYGERGTGQSGTPFYIYTRQGGVEQRVPRQDLHYSLMNLSPGNYDIYMQTNTEAGTGAAGPTSTINIVCEETSLVIVVVKCVVPALILTLLGLLLACLTQNDMVKQKLCQDIPDPSHSSLAHWTPKAPLENMKWPPTTEKSKIHYSEITLVSKSVLQDSDPALDLSYHTACSLRTYSSPHLYSAPPVGSEKERIRGSLTVPAWTHNSILSLLSQPPQTLPRPLQSRSCLQPSDCQYTTVCVHDSGLQPGGASELHEPLQGESDAGSDLSLSQADGLEAPSLSVAEKKSLVLQSHSSFSLSPAAEAGSPDCSFSPSHFSSVPPLQLDPFTCPVPLSKSFSTTLSPFPHPLLVDFSYSLLPGQYSMDCDPYISPPV